MIRMIQMVVAAAVPVLVALLAGTVDMAVAQSVPDIDLECSCSYRIDGDVITFGAAAVANTRSGGTSGTLTLKMWATSAPYRGGTINGYLLAEERLGELMGGYRYTSLSYTASLEAPPAGTYYITMTVTEYDGQDYIMDYVTFDDPATFGGGIRVDPGGRGVPVTPGNRSAGASECSYAVTVRNGADDFSASTRIRAAACWIEGSNAGATVEAGEARHAGRSGGASVWWAWTAPAAGTAEFSTLGSSFDTLLAVYSLSGGVRTEVAANDDIDFDGGVYQSAVAFEAQAGRTYYVAVDGYDGATGDVVLRWRVQESAQDLDDANPLDDFNVRIPASCPRQVEICVRDHQCEDGDAVAVSVNGVEVLRTELFNAPRCIDIAVREGVNTISLLALNGTGFKGSCSFVDENTGEITVAGSQRSQNWRHRGGAGSRANLNVTVGGSGPCP